MQKLGDHFKNLKDVFMKHFNSVLFCHLKVAG